MARAVREGGSRKEDWLGPGKQDRTRLWDGGYLCFG